MTLLRVGGLCRVSSPSDWVGNGARPSGHGGDMKRSPMLCPGRADGVLKMPQEGKKRRMQLPKSPQFPLGLLAAAVAVIVAAWWWLGRPIAMPVGPGDIGRLQCISYAPFRPGQNPLQAGTHVAAVQIEEDLGRLRQLTDCVRTYSIEHGVDQVPAIAQRLGMKVMLGLWLSPDRAKDRVQVDTAVALAKRFPDVVTDVIVGNEVLLRGDMSAVDLAGFIREVKAAVPCRVTYADVWEFWNRNPEIGRAHV